MTRVTIEVQDNSKGFSVTVENVAVIKEGYKTIYKINDNSFDNMPDTIDRKTKDLLQVAYLVYRQKEQSYQGQRDDLINEILQM